MPALKAPDWHVSAYGTTNFLIGRIDKRSRVAIIEAEDPVEAGHQMADPNFGTFSRAGTIADQASFDAGLRAHMVRVYNYLASGAWQWPGL